jgi:hypothetical protein
MQYKLFALKETGNSKCPHPRGISIVRRTIITCPEKDLRVNKKD